MKTMNCVTDSFTDLYTDIHSMNNVIEVHFRITGIDIWHFTTVISSSRNVIGKRDWHSTHNNRFVHTCNDRAFDMKQVLWYIATLRSYLSNRKSVSLQLTHRQTIPPTFMLPGHIITRNKINGFQFTWNIFNNTNHIHKAIELVAISCAAFSISERVREKESYAERRSERERNGHFLSRNCVHTICPFNSNWMQPLIKITTEKCFLVIFHTNRGTIWDIRM